MPIHIAILDDGVNAAYYRLGPLQHDLEIEADGKIKERAFALEDSHGTTCAAIIKKYAPDVALSSIKMLNAMDTGNVAGLISALYWCRDHRVDIVHLSLGTTVFTDFEAVSKAILRLLEKNILVVAAVSNGNKFTLPAHMAGVFAVVHAKTLLDDKIVVQDGACKNILIQASGRHFLRNHAGKITITRPSNSFAAPAVTARIAQIIEKTETKDVKKIIENMTKTTEKDIKNSIPLYLPYCFARARILGKIPCRKQVFFTHDDTADTLVCTNIESMEQYLSHSGNKVRNIVYAGALSPGERTRFEKKIKGILCDEQDLCVEAGPQKESTIPLIGLQGDKTSVIILMQKLSTLFFKKGFYSIASTDIPRGYLYGFYWFKDMGKLPYRLSFLEQKFKNDLLMFGTESLGEHADQFDYVVDVGKGSSKKRGRTPSFSAENISEQSVGELFDAILRHFA